MSPQIYIHPEPQKVTLFGSKVFADVINQIKVRSFWIRVGPNPMTDILIGRGNLYADTLNKSHVMMEAEIVVMCLQAKEYQGRLADLPEVRKQQGRILP